MSEYKGIKGFSIQSLSADPADPNVGQVWYNSTSGSWKVAGVTTAGTWATGNNMNTARHFLAGAGTQTAGLGFGGYIYPGATRTDVTEEYDGVSWTNSNPMGTAKYMMGGSGTQTAGLVFGRRKWRGSCWR